MNAILPHISKRAVKRVTNELPPPDLCPYCAGGVELVENSEIYGGRTFGKWPYAYLCRPCNAYVGLHPDTDIPLGTLANVELREARKVHKGTFHRMMEAENLSRGSAYKWLAEAMQIDTGACHFGWFNLEQCALAGQLCQMKMNGQID